MEEESGSFRELLRYFWTHKYASYVIFLIVIIYSLNQFDRYLYAVSEIPYLDYSSTQYGLIAGPLFTVIYSLAGVFIGAWGELSKVKVLSFALFFWSIMTAIVAITDSFWQIALLRVGQGIGEAGCTPFATGIIADFVPAELIGSAMGVYNTGIYIGYGLALGLGTYMHDEIGWESPYVFGGLIGIGVAALLLLTVKDDKRKRSSSLSFEGSDARIVSIDSTSSNKSQSDWKKRAKVISKYWLTTPSIILLCLAGGVRNAGGYVWGNYTAVFFHSKWDKYDDQDGTCIYSYSDDYTGDQVCDDDYPYCRSGDCYDLDGTPWHNEGMSSERFESFMSWIPLVAGSLGAILGGVISDKLAKGKSPIYRLSIVIISNVLASPFSAGALFAPYPWCFLCLIPANIIGEMWIGVTLAVVIDLVPKKIRVTSVAIYLFIITNIGGNASIIVPYLQDALDSSHTFEFQAAPPIDMNTNSTSDIDYSVEENGSHGLQWALFWLYPGVYFISSGFFILAFIFLRRDLRKKEYLEMKMENDEMTGFGSLNTSLLDDDVYEDKNTTYNHLIHENEEDAFS